MLKQIYEYKQLAYTTVLSWHKSGRFQCANKRDEREGDNKIQPVAIMEKSSD